MRALSAADTGGAGLRHHLVLAGGGHTHALLLRRWLMRPGQRPAATLVTLVSRHSTALYSGSVPALVAGLLEPEECRIDLRRLCALAGVSFLQAEILGLDPRGRELRLRGRPPLRFDRLSLDVGAVTAAVEAEAEPWAAPEPETQPEAEPEAETEAESEAETEPYAGAETETKTETGSSAWAEAAAASGAAAEANAGAVAQAAAAAKGNAAAKAQEVAAEGALAAADPGGYGRDVRAGTPSLAIPSAGIPSERGSPAAGSGFGLPVKPLEPFLAWLADRPAGSPLRIRGGGAAAVELALALRARGFAPRLLLRGEELRLGSAAACRRAERLLAQASIPVQRRVAATAPADLACTGSRAPGWLAASGLPVDPNDGRVLTDAGLEVIGWPGLFAVGDCGRLRDAPRAASGVWAVRATPWLAINLKRSLERPGAPLRRWQPRRRALQLLGDGGCGGRGPRALALWGPLALGPSRWLWRWKRHLDQRFLRRFADLAPASAPESAMACRGCAAKLAAAPLQAALARLAALAPAVLAPPAGPAAATHPAPAPPPDQALPGVWVSGGSGPGILAEDAALIAATAAGEALLQSLDGFPALLSDPWLNARLTTLHACGDLWASGAAVTSVQALVTLPVAAAALQEELLLQTLAGVASVLEPLGARLRGGHTLEGRDGAGLALALSVNGLAAGRVWPKGPLVAGDRLLLCGSLGSGVLFAAAAAGAARPEWIELALERMQRSQAPLVALLAGHGCRACTDVTGFGLLGHLGEMVASAGPTVAAEASSAVALSVAAAAAAAAAEPCREHGPGGSAVAEPRIELWPGAIAALPGSLELLERGWASSLAPANAQALGLLDGALRCAGGLPDAARQALLIDPQTCGPLLAALPAASADAALAAVRAAGFAEAAQIGRVLGG